MTLIVFMILGMLYMSLSSIGSWISVRVFDFFWIAQNTDFHGVFFVVFCLFVTLMASYYVSGGYNGEPEPETEED
jgi:hypothetical protein